VTGDPQGSRCANGQQGGGHTHTALPLTSSRIAALRPGFGAKYLLVSGMRVMGDTACILSLGGDADAWAHIFERQARTIRHTHVGTRF